MEMVDYLTLRWKAFTGALLVGIAVIVALGLGAGGSGYEAQTQLLVRPPADLQAAYASDPDRYIETEMALLYTPGALEEEVRGTDVTAPRLAQSLTYSHSPGSDLVTLQVISDDPGEAVDLVNGVARIYLEDAQQRISSATTEQAAKLDDRIAKTSARLAKVNTRLAGVTSAFAAANPGLSVPPLPLLAPDEYSRQVLLTGQLQQLSQQRTSLSLTPPATISSRVLNPAVGASAPEGWALTTYAAAVLGLLLLLLTAAGVGLALSRRVLGETRWNDATGEGRLPRAIQARGRTHEQRQETLRRVSAALALHGSSEGAVHTVYLPGRSSTLERRSAFLLQGLAEDGVRTSEDVSLTDLVTGSRDHPSRPGHFCTPVLLLVDRRRSLLEDADTLGNYPEPLQRMMVPVLM